MLDGIDVSNWQGNIAWAAVPAKYRFVVAKATEGTGYRDPYLGRNWTGARGRDRSAYHFARPGGGAGGAIAEARFFVDTVRGVGGPAELPLTLDLESSGGLGPSALVEWTLAFLRECDRLTARRTILYTYESFMNSNLRGDQRLRPWPLWIAKYCGGCAPSTPWPWTMYQWSSSGSVPGVAGRCDVNWADETRYAAMSGGQGGDEMTEDQWNAIRFGFAVVGKLYDKVERLDRAITGVGTDVDPGTGLPSTGFGSTAVLQTVSQIGHAIRSDKDWPKNEVATIRTLVEGIDAGSVDADAVAAQIIDAGLAESVVAAIGSRLTS